jgi:hypothetical protein
MTTANPASHPSQPLGSWTGVPETRAILRQVGETPPALASRHYVYASNRDVEVHYTNLDKNVKALRLARKVWLLQFGEGSEVWLRLDADQITVDDAIDCAVSVARAEKRAA